MSTTTIWYARADYGSAYRHSVTVGGSWDSMDSFDAENLAQECAEDYHSNHDGWEASWPLTFALYASKDGPEVGRFEVEREMEPTFMASPVAVPVAGSETP